MRCFFSIIHFINSLGSTSGGPLHSPIKFKLSALCILQSSGKTITMRNCPDKVGLHACLQVVVLATLTEMERLAHWHRQHYSLELFSPGLPKRGDGLSTGGYAQLFSPALDYASKFFKFLLWISCNDGMWSGTVSKINLFSHKLILVRIFYNK